ncbi:MAG: hypothetical protein J1G07_01810 [Clostridiales bacterium]|nr:hypothetical protein [Clostridiales bacterium]
MEIFLTMGINSNLLYIDPAATSMLLTSITAIVAACGAGIFIAWRAIKKKVNKALHIDENAKKEVEGELVISDELKDEASTEENKSEQIISGENTASNETTDTADATTEEK